MATENSSNAGSSIGFVGALTILFIALKLTGVIDWAWIWVLSPLWVTALAVLGALLVVGSVVLVIHIAGERRQKRMTELRRTYGVTRGKK